MITFQSLDQAHVPAFVDLFRREKGQVRAHQVPEYLAWSFFDQPLARADRPVVEIAVEAGQVLGVMGAIPQTILWGDRAVDGAFFVDWLVDSSQRRRKIGSQLIKRAAARFPVSVHMGSTPSGYATCATLGARDCGATMTVRRVLAPGRWAAGSARANRLTRLIWTGAQTVRGLARPRLKNDPGQVQIVDLLAIDESLRAFARELAQTHVCTLRTGARWAWLLRAPLYAGFAIQVNGTDGRLGFAALVVARRAGRRIGSVADISVRRAEDAPAVLAAAVRALARERVDGITCTISAPIAADLVANDAFTVLNQPLMGTWLAPGYEAILDRPWFMTMAENLSVAAGVDLPVHVPTLVGGRA